MLAAFPATPRPTDSASLVVCRRAQRSRACAMFDGGDPAGRGTISIHDSVLAVM